MDTKKQHIILQEEIANSISHGLGLVFGLVAIPILTALAATSGSTTAIVGTAVYGFGFLFVFGSSTIYHSVTHPKIKKVMNVLDHISIFIMIAGSYTPFILAYYFNSFGITILCLIWGMALLGIIMKLVFSVRYHFFSTFCYLAMGWTIVLFGKSFFTTIPLECTILLGVGGLFYTLGVVFFLWEKLDYNHAIWHVFVLVASICHYVAILLTVV
ncbi:MAG: hemolysin III family protein [Bacteroidota bacterium]